MTAVQAVALTLALSVVLTTATCGDASGSSDCDDSPQESSASLHLLQTRMTVSRTSPSGEASADGTAIDLASSLDEASEYFAAAQVSDEEQGGRREEEGDQELEDTNGKPKPKPKPKEPKEPKPVKGPLFTMGIDNGESCIDAVPGPKGATYTPSMCCPEGYEDVKVSVSCAAAVASLGVNTGKWEPWEDTDEAKRITFGGILRKDIEQHPFGCIMFKFKPNPKKPLYKFKIMFNPGAGDIFGNDIREVAPGKLTATDKVICQKKGAQIGQNTGGGAGFGLSVPKIKEEAYDEGYDEGYDDGWDEALEDEGDDDDDDDDDDDEGKKGRR